MKLSLDALQLLDTVARKGSFAAAAEALHRVPSAVTYAARKLEQDLGVELFERKGKQLVMNDMGKMVFAYAEDIFSLGAELQQSMRNKDSKEQFRFAVGVTDVIPKILSVEIL